MKSNLAFLRGRPSSKDKWDPPSLFTAVHAATVTRWRPSCMRPFGSAGKAA